MGSGRRCANMTLTPRTGLAARFVINPPNGNIVVVPARTGFGDTAGAMLELLEMAVLVGLALV